MLRVCGQAQRGSLSHEFLPPGPAVPQHQHGFACTCLLSNQAGVELPYGGSKLRSLQRLVIIKHLMKITGGKKKKDHFSGCFCTVGYWCMAIHSPCAVQKSVVKIFFSCSNSANQANPLLRVGTSGPRKISLGPRTWIYLPLQIAD